MRKLFLVAAVLLLTTLLPSCSKESGDAKPISEVQNVGKSSYKGKHEMNQDTDLSPEADKFLADATAEFHAKQGAMGRELKLESSNHWDYDQLSGILKLQYPDGTDVQADGQILGSYNAADRTWEWAWNNPNALPNVARDSLLVREAGKKHGIGYLQAGVVPVPNEDFVAYLCGIGLKATDSIGVYRGKTGPIDVFIMLKNPKWDKKSA
jgi:hypothetical protein